MLTDIFKVEEERRYTPFICYLHCVCVIYCVIQNCFVNFDHFLTIISEIM